MPREAAPPSSPDCLGSEGQSVLAVLVLAALWPERFPGGWVGVDAFAKCGLLLGERRSRESLKAAIRRGLRQLARVAAVPRVERRRTLERDPLTCRPRRDHDRRLSESSCPELEEWLLRRGQELIAPRLWRDLLQPDQDGSVQDRDQRRQTPCRLLRQADKAVKLAARLVPSASLEAILLERARLALRAALSGLSAQADRAF